MLCNKPNTVPGTRRLLFIQQTAVEGLLIINARHWRTSVAASTVSELGEEGAFCTKCYRINHVEGGKLICLGEWRNVSPKSKLELCLEDT